MMLRLSTRSTPKAPPAEPLPPARPRLRTPSARSRRSSGGCSGWPPASSTTPTASVRGSAGAPAPRRAPRDAGEHLEQEEEGPGKAPLLAERPITTGDAQTGDPVENRLLTGAFRPGKAGARSGSELPANQRVEEREKSTECASRDARVMHGGGSTTTQTPGRPGHRAHCHQPTRRGRRPPPGVGRGHPELAAASSPPRVRRAFPPRCRAAPA